ncbi:PepSY-associated TM helix domain-containing protein [Novosphingobium sp.]|uniref:PepSY-associated TM helix domain-containing protein n=1 Tax=Novosphingobium sp. TaxID=1874826 RepID=UPI00262CA674|nr:PepSY-associated TM helix domain-containing protein [Novosphingobium sp.]
MTLRPLFGLLHRWVGLVIAGFLIVSGVTGAIISWDHELDDLLNPQLMEARSSGPALSALALAARVEAADPRVRVTSFALVPEPGATLTFGVDAKRDPAAGRQFEPGYNQVFLDPATGAEQGRRNWGAVWPVTRENLVSFLYVLHYSLHIPEMWGINRWGVWLMGIVAVLWTIDSFVGFYLTLPSRSKAPAAGGKSFWQRWRPAWRIKRSGSAFRINFDIHRAFGLWLWGLLFMLAFTAFSLNLYSEVFYPVLSRVSTVTPTPFDTRVPAALDAPIVPKLGFAPILEKAADEGRARRWAAPVGSVFYAQAYGIYGVAFHEPGGDHGAAGVGPPYLYYDGADGRLLGDRQPWKGTTADIFVQAQFPLHSGRILGLPGRILISAMGLVVAALSVTGLVIWWRKRAARNGRRVRRRGSSPSGAGLALRRPISVNPTE